MIASPFNIVLQKCFSRDFPGGPVVKTLPSNAEDAGLIPGWGAMIPHASGRKTKTKQKQYCNKFTNDFKNGLHWKKKKLKKKNASSTLILMT